MIRTFFLLLSLSSFSALTAQSQKTIDIGEKIPNIELGKVLNNEKQVIRFSDFKGKLVILDFWSIWCKSCISSMTKMEALQKKFADRIQVVLITPNSKESVESLFKKVSIKKPNLPIIVEDTVLGNYFPADAFPYHVWIDQDGSVIYETEEYNATEEHIEAILNKQKLNITNRPRANNSYNPDQSLLRFADDSLQEHIKAYSLLFTGLNDRIPNYGIIRIFKDSITGNPYLIRAINVPLISLYNMAFENDLFGFQVSSTRLLNNNRLIVEAGSPDRLKRPSDGNEIDKWDSEYLFSYELKLPMGSSNRDAFRFMQNDLNKSLNYCAKIEKRKMKCLVLVKISNEDKIKSISGKQPKSGYDSMNNFYVNNKPINASLLPSLVYANQYLFTPIIDSSGYEQCIDIMIKDGLQYSSNLRKELVKYGLDLIEQALEVEMLVITDRK